MTLLNEVRNAGRAALDLLYPPACFVCGAGGSFLCDGCLEALPRADGERCERCWLPLRGRGCYACLERPLPLEAVRSVFRYEGGVRRLVRGLKFRGYSCLAPILGEQLAQCYEAYDLDADVIVPVPLTGWRRRTRGFNQALLLANAVSLAHQLPVVEALRRKGQAPNQASSLTADQRRRNVERVFSVSMPEAVQGRRVLLVDDVATTSATLSACALQLLHSGAETVLGLTAARED
jgi:ComF family protein